MVSEERFQELVAAWLRDSFADVETEVYLEGVHRYVDFVAYTPFQSYAVEVENDWSSVFDGLGQSTLYAAATGHEPVVVFPADAVDAEELGILQAEDAAPRIETV